MSFVLLAMQLLIYFFKGAGLYFAIVNPNQLNIKAMKTFLITNALLLLTAIVAVSLNLDQIQLWIESASVIESGTSLFSSNSEAYHLTNGQVLRNGAILFGGLFVFVAIATFVEGSKYRYRSA